MTKRIKKPKLINLDKKNTKYIPILSGPPNNYCLQSGLVILQPQKSCGKHSTENYEELLIVLEGKGKVEITGKRSIPIKANVAVYHPPHTEHNVINTGTELLKYIYIVTKVV